MPFSLFLALKYLQPKRSFVSIVTAISVMGVLLGVAILIIVLAVMTGFGEMWRTKILSFKPHLIVQGAYGVIENEDDLCERISHLKGVTGVAPAIETRVLVQSEGNTAAPIVVGIDARRAHTVSQVPSNIISGVFSLDDNGLVLGLDLAGSLNARVGSPVLMYSPMNVMRPDELYLPEELTISGIFDMGMRDFDAGFMLTSLEVARELVGLESGAQSIYVMTDDPFNHEELRLRVREAVGPTFNVRSWVMIDNALFDALAHEKILMMMLLFFITIVAIFCVTNTLIVITVQKTSEIGLMKALGIPSSKIVGAFVWHGWMQCLIGTILGIGTGYLVLYNLNSIAEGLRNMGVPVFPKGIYGLSEIPWSIAPVEVAIIAGVVLAFCTVASVIPAYRAARLDPVEALRHE
jgi:lipoprotein-releasing system permease protein